MMKRVLATFSALVLVVTLGLLSGCSGAAQGNAQAKQAAYDAESAALQLAILAAGENPNDGEVNVEFVEAWQTGDIEYEIYQANEDMISLDWHTTCLIGVANDNGAGWEKVQSSDLEPAGHKFTDSEIAAFKTLCEFEANPIDYDAVEREAEANSAKSADMGASSDSVAFGDGETVYRNSENGKTLTVKELLDRADGAMGYLIAFSDGTETQVLYDRMEANNDGDTDDVFIDDGFGVEMHHGNGTPKRVIIVASTRGAQEYAGYYIAD